MSSTSSMYQAHPVLILLYFALAICVLLICFYLFQFFFVVIFQFLFSNFKLAETYEIFVLNCGLSKKACDFRISVCFDDKWSFLDANSLPSIVLKLKICAHSFVLVGWRFFAHHFCHLVGIVFIAVVFDCSTLFLPSHLFVFYFFFFFFH